MSVELEGALSVGISQTLEGGGVEKTEGGLDSKKQYALDFSSFYY